MLSFFRRIRVRLLQQKRFSKYLLYAVGEIILVVIGILIALQVNNANENRKEAYRVEGFIKQLKLQIEKNVISLENFKNVNAERLQVSKRLLANLYDENASKNIDDLNILILNNVYDYQLNLDMIIIEEAKSNGNFDLIASDSLRISLYNYVNKYERFTRREVVINEDLTLNLKPYLNDHYNLRYLINSTGEFDLGRSPFADTDYLQMLKDPIFENHIVTRIMFAEEAMFLMVDLENLLKNLTVWLQEY